VAKRCILGHSYYGTLIGNPTPGIQWYNFRPPGVTPNWGMRRFLSNYFDLLFTLLYDIISAYLTYESFNSPMQEKILRLVSNPTDGVVYA